MMTQDERHWIVQSRTIQNKLRRPVLLTRTRYPSEILIDKIFAKLLEVYWKRWIYWLKQELTNAFLNAISRTNCFDRLSIWLMVAETDIRIIQVES
jgi:hypothetical protein